MSFPTLKVEVAFGAHIFDASPTWSDITTHVRSCTISRGRNYELDNFEAGTCVLVLNDDGSFDPLNNNGQYAPNIRPHKQVRVSATYNSVRYPLYKGYVERWEPSRESRYQASCRVTAVDALAMFQRFMFRRHDDGNGNGAGRKNLGVFNHQANTFTQHGVFTGNDEAVRIYALIDATYLTGSSDAGPFSDHLVYKITYTNGNGTSGRVGHLEVKWPHHAQHPHHRWSEKLNVTLAGSDTVHSVQKVEHKSGKFHGKSMKITLWGERPIIPRGLGSAQLKSVLKHCGWPSGQINIRHAGRFTQAPSSPWNQSLLDAIRLIQDSEAGQIYMDASGEVVFEDRDWRYNRWPASPAAWTDASSTTTSTDNIFSDISPSMDNEHLFNQWEVTRETTNPGDSPSTQLAVSSHSKNLYGVLVNQRSVTLQTDTDAKKLARYLLRRTESPQYRVPSLLIKPRKNADVMFPQVLGMEISDALVVDQHRPSSGSTLYRTSAHMNIEHITHTITVDDWQTELELAPRVTTAFAGS